MKLKNYTSAISPEKSVLLIEKRLVEIGASDIVKSYDGNSHLSGIMFRIKDGEQVLVFKLPACVNEVYETLMENVKRPRPNTKNLVWQQAERTAWKLLLDDVFVQTSMILIGRRKVTEVFLAYLYDSKNDETLYQKLVISTNNFKQLMPPK